MDSFSTSEPPRKQSQSDSNLASYDKLDDDNFLEPYQPNNADFLEPVDDTEEVQDTMEHIEPLSFEHSTSPPEATQTYISDQPLPPSKYSSVDEFTADYWKERKQKMYDVKEIDMLNKTKNMSVPMARVKKIMRIDDDVRSLMIASDAPIFMAQAAEFFIEEMTGMGWQFVSESRRRILQRNDIAAAVKKSDQFDFLIDFLPPPIKDSVPPPNPIFAPPSEHNPFFPPKEPTNGASTSAHSEPSVPSDLSVLNEMVEDSNEPSFQQRRSFEERRKREIPPHRMASDRFKCVLNETPSGNEYQIMEVPRSCAPSTSTTSPSANTRRSVRTPKKNGT